MVLAPSRRAGEGSARGRLYGPFTGGAAVGSGGGVGAEGSAWTVDGAGRRSRRCGAASAALCAAPLAALGVLWACAARGGGGGAGRSAWIVAARHARAGTRRRRGGAARVAEAEMARLQTKDATKRDDARERRIDAVIDDEAEECEGDVVVVR